MNYGDLDSENPFLVRSGFQYIDFDVGFNGGHGDLMTLIRNVSKHIFLLCLAQWTIALIAGEFDIYECQSLQEGCLGTQPHVLRSSRRNEVAQQTLEPYEISIINYKNT